ncbi:MAG: hypothetical protein GEU28_04795 [Dehalococcoidia bacterium]|nr:hypothetical protein [Dehalococcoidia bacterium]
MTSAEEAAQPAHAIQKPLACIAAMDVEASALRDAIQVSDEGRDGEMSYWLGRTKDGLPLAVVLSGIGPVNAGRATESVLDLIDPFAVVSFGVAGGLAPGFHFGEIALCETVRNEDGEAFASDPSMLEAAEAVLSNGASRWRRATSLTVDHVITTPADKARLHRETGAHVVEMESLAVTRAAAARGIPFVVLRSVSDLDETPLPDFSEFMEDYKVNADRLRAHLLDHPEDRSPLEHFLEVTRAAAADFSRILPGLALASSSRPGAGA